VFLNGSADYLVERLAAEISDENYEDKLAGLLSRCYATEIAEATSSRYPASASSTMSSVRKTLDTRYDDLKSGRVKPIDGEAVFKTLREKSERRRAGG
jgi:hypothetical protein